ncbi:MAG: outer membrane lipoprotein-sorting protein [Candidatus Marinimicrobia bacterium]|nr:outer membrane lipoprotein-sorting protein [Candidatus Neomarinimicrobiota bacterium]
MNAKIITTLLLCTVMVAFAAYPDGDELLKKMDKVMASDTQKLTSKMIINTNRGSRTIETRSYTKGEDYSFTEYLAPAREEGIKMLKIGDDLWTYDPDADRTITISGHMLRQSINGSDLSYEDMMSDETLNDDYKATTKGEEIIFDRACWVVELTALKVDVAYSTRKLWIDKERYLPLRGEYFAKSGKLLKRMEILKVMQTDGRWFPKEMHYQDVLNKKSKGTSFIIESVEFDVDIPKYLFTKAALKK